MIQSIPLTFALKAHVFLGWLFPASLLQARPGKGDGDCSPPSDSDTIAAYSHAPDSSPHTSRSEGFLFFLSFTYLFLTQCNAPFHRAAQEKWNGGQTAGCRLPSLGVTPNPFTGRWALPCIKTHLWFIVCDFPPPPPRKWGSAAKR